MGKIVWSMVPSRIKARMRITLEDRNMARFAIYHILIDMFSNIAKSNQMRKSPIKLMKSDLHISSNGKNLMRYFHSPTKPTKSQPRVVSPPATRPKTARPRPRRPGWRRRSRTPRMPAVSAAKPTSGKNDRIPNHRAALAQRLYGCAAARAPDSRDRWRVLSGHRRRREGRGRGGCRHLCRRAAAPRRGPRT